MPRGWHSALPLCSEKRGSVVAMATTGSKELRVPSLLQSLQERGLEELQRRSVEEWLANEHYREERPSLMRTLQAAMQEDAALEELKDAFYQQLPIGTGGRRGKVAPGPNRVNSVTLRETVYGLVCAMRSQGWAPKVVVGYDTRWDSRTFAHLAAKLFLAQDVQVHLLDAPRPTPQLAFWLRRLGCGAGVVISASHNPPGDNGIKIYGPDGAQVFGPRDRALSQAILQEGPKAPACSDGALESHPLLTLMNVEQSDADYVEEVKAQGLLPQLDLSSCGAVVYTALQGVGTPNMSAVLRSRGVDLHCVAEQCDAGDGRFSRTRATNPEDPRAFDAAIELAQELGAKILLANDPDADRLGLCLWSEREQRYVVLEGNLVCALLVDHVGRHAKDGPQAFVASTLVTTGMVPKIAASYGLTCIDDLLVGFKHHAALVEQYQGRPLALGCEESLGYNRGRNIRDKDGAIAALLVCELFADLAREGRSWEERLDELWLQHGVHLQHTENLRFEGRAGAEHMQKVMQHWREHFPESLGAFDCEAWSDRLQPPAEHRGDPVRGAPSNLLLGRFRRGEHRVKLVLRPSGTEPKLKLYLLCEASVAEAAQLARVKAELIAAQQEILHAAKTKILRWA